MPGPSTDEAGSGNYQRITVPADFGESTLTITEYTVSTDDPEHDLPEAAALMRVKKDLPLAMQRHDSTMFADLLARDFLCADAPGIPDGEFLTRASYIHDRVHGAWTITHVRYSDIVIHMMGEMAVMTYRNHLNELDAAGRPVFWNYTWTDVWAKEGGRWKLRYLFTHDARSELDSATMRPE